MNNKFFNAHSTDEAEDSFWGAEFPNDVQAQTEVPANPNPANQSKPQETDYVLFAFIFIIIAGILIYALYVITKPKKAAVHRTARPVKKAPSAVKRPVKKIKTSESASIADTLGGMPLSHADTVNAVSSSEAEPKSVNVPVDDAVVQDTPDTDAAAETKEKEVSDLATPDSVKDCIQSFLKITKDI